MRKLCHRLDLTVICATHYQLSKTLSILSKLEDLARAPYMAMRKMVKQFNFDLDINELHDYYGKTI